MNDRKKIGLFMLPLLTQGGGAEKYFIELAQNLSNYNDVQADIITMNESFFKKFVRLLFTLNLRFNFKIDISGREKEEDIIKKLGKAKWIKSSFGDLANNLNNYNVIYSKNEIVDLILLKLIGYKKLPPIIVGIHTPIYYPIVKSFNSKLHNFIYSGLLYRWLLNGVQLVHVSNKFTQNFLNQHFKVNSKLIYYPFLVDEILEEKEKYKSSFIFSNSLINIAFVGRLSEQKGIDILISIINKLIMKKEISKKLVLNIFGNGEEKYNLKMKNISKTYSWVKYFGHIENKYIPNILSKQDLLISTSKWEVLPFNILEAQGMGLPVIAFNIPGPNDIIVNGETGFLLDNEDEFINRLLGFIENKYYFDKNEIQSIIKIKFDPKIIYNNLLLMFKDAINYEKA